MTTNNNRRIGKCTVIFILNILVILLTISTLEAQGWVKDFPTDPALYFNRDQKLITTHDNGILMMYKDFGRDTLGDYVYGIKLVKTDHDGNIQWERLFLDTIYDNSLEVEDIVLSPDNGYGMVTTYHYTLGGGSCNRQASVKFDQSGNTIWQNFNTSICGSDHNRITTSPNQGYLVTGIAPSQQRMIKVDSTGNTEWIIQNTQLPSFLSWKTVTNLNNTYTLGGFSSNNINSRASLRTIDVAGNIVWENSYQFSLDSTHNSAFYDIAKTDDGGFIATGKICEPACIPLLVKTDSVGTIEWANSFPQFVITYGTIAVTPTSDGYAVASKKEQIGHIFKTDKSGNILWERADSTRFYHDITFSSGYIYAIGWDDDKSTVSLIKLNESGDFFYNYLTGNVSHDNNFNCSRDPLELNLDNWMLRADGTNGTFYGLTDSLGNYEISVDTGSYYLNLTFPNPLWKACQPLHMVNVLTNDTIQTNFTPQTAIECPHLVVDISTPFVRRCFSNKYTLSYCNWGTAAAQNAYVEVEFPYQMNVDSSSIPWNTQSGNVFSFSLGTVDLGDCGSFCIYATPICDSTILEQTMCVKAHIFPDSICVPSDTAWEGSITTLNVNCQPDSVTFVIKNTGNGDMLTPQEYFVIEDDLLMKQGFFQLISNDSLLIKVPSNGSTYRLYAGQSPGHFPPTYYPTIVIEGCGVNSNGTFSLGYVTMFQENDVLDQVSIDCQEIIGPTDPNDKRAEPKGSGAEHYIKVGDDLDYHIRFQNVGTDTAFTVVVLDTISQYLDIASLQQGASSHPYDLTIIGGNILKFTFDDIKLVDSTANEPSSHGFVKFKISQVSNLPLGTMIYNSAAIYFDYEAPVITNQTHHEIGEDFIHVVQCSDLTTTSYILPSTISELSTIEIAVKISEINDIDTDGRPITVRMPSDPRLLFAWDVSLNTAAFIPVQNADWNYLGDNGLFHSWTFNSTGLILPGGTSSAFGLQAFFDPQSTDGTTTFSATVVPFSGGECNITNNGDVEQLVYFD